MAKTLRNLASYCLMPLLLGGAVFLTYAAIQRGYPEVLILNIVMVALFLIILALERLLPHRPDWNRSDGQILQDLGHTVFGTGLGAMIGNFLAQMAFGSLGLWISRRYDGGLWPHSWPLWAQVIAVFLLADLGRYWQHRLLHSVPWLWRFHSLHHSGHRLNVFKTSRSHITERIMQQVFMFGPLILLGVPAHVLLFYIIPNSFLGMFDHSNADFRIGPLGHVIMGPQGHRIHHSADMREGNSNFGSALVIWDIVFGTYISHVAQPSPREVGIHADPTPSGFIAQVLEPFMRRRDLS